MENKYKNKKVLVLGLAKSGFYAAKLLNELGAEVILNDKKDLSKNSRAKILKEMGINIISGEHPSDLMEENFDLLVKNPGIPYNNKIIREAINKNISVITEVELASTVTKAHFIGITGTNGKTTTTTMIQEMLATSSSKRSTYAVGNIGIPVSQLALTAKTEDYLVAELSSFQLAGAPTIHPEIAVITNITEDHLDFHGSKKAYVESKLNLVKNQTEKDMLIYNEDQDGLKEVLTKRSKAQLLPFSRKKYLKNGVSVKNRFIYFKEDLVAKLSDIEIKGTHNLENFLAAIAVAKVKKISNENIKKIMKEFKGVKHRTQFLLKWNDRSFYNDSKATNIEATEKALSAFNQSVILLAGGLNRGDNYEKLIPYFKEHVKALVVFGETAPELKKIATLSGIQKVIEVGKMSEAVRNAYHISSPGDIILLSPAAASWDQYQNFEERGNQFIDSVNNLTINDNI